MPEDKKELSKLEKIANEIELTEEETRQIDFVELLGLQVSCPFIRQEKNDYVSCQLNRFKQEYIVPDCVYNLVNSTPPLYVNQCFMKSTPENLFFNIAKKSYERVKLVKEVKK